jgi:hypothetical protein
MAEPLIINSAESLSKAIGIIREEWHSARFLRVTIKKGKARSLDQNAISHCWYEQLGRELRENDTLGWRCFCKFTFGVPLLHSEDAEFRAFWDNAVRTVFSYEQKIEMMKFVPVTSLMSKPVISKYLEAMQAHFLKLGVMLEFPKDD